MKATLSTAVVSIDEKEAAIGTKEAAIVAKDAALKEKEDALVAAATALKISQANEQRHSNSGAVPSK